MDELNAIAATVRVCQKCPLSATRKNAVPGEGPHNADIMVIGEGPGFHEDNQGRPFIGPSGSFLTELLAKAGYKREEVFIANVVKCRPPNNRDPLPEEIAACAPYLDSQIEVINPKVIVTVGRFSMARYFKGEKISAIHGKAKTINGRVIVAMFHPAAALHNPQLRPALEEDFANLRQIIAHESAKRVASTPNAASAPGAVSVPKAPPESDAGEQLSLF